MKENKLIIVSNRLPVKLKIKEDQWHFQTSEGGLATGLKSVFKDGNSVWVGWPGAPVSNELMWEDISAALKEQNLFPVDLNEEEISQFYDGFSNETLWPLFHYFPSYARYAPKAWEYYQQVNKKFAAAILSIASPGDKIWIQDYHLLLLPQLLRKQLPDNRIGFFQHIPFPSYEVFRMIPWREKLLEGMLGADLIGFHTYDDVRHFMSAATRLLNLQSNGNEIITNHHTVSVDAFPMGIDYEKFRTNVFKDITQRNIQKLDQLIGNRKMILSIDRLDYSKGIPQRLKAFALFLKNFPEYKERVVLLQLVVPSRDNVPQYATLKQEINRLVSEINAQYGSLTWQPIHYFYRSFPDEMLSALYAKADIGLVTPLRDGMNLVCKEYVASKTDGMGVLILSEMAGASKELYDALIINPTNLDAVVKALYCALKMPAEEQQKRMHNMQHILSRFTIHHWIHNFMFRLDEVKEKQFLQNTHSITPEVAHNFRLQYAGAQRRLLFLDYDGTLVPFHSDPEQAVPDSDLMDLLRQLYKDPRNHLVIISGRKKDFLEKWLGDLPVDIIAEHGAWLKEQPKGWYATEEIASDWKAEFRPLLQQFEMRTPGSFIEEKDYSLVWHYRMTESGLGDLRASELINNLKYAIGSFGLQLLEGNKVIELKSSLINKGKAARKWLLRYPDAFIVAIGDDHTDEDTFKAMPPEAITIKVGTGNSEASYVLKSPGAVRNFLQNLQVAVAQKEYSTLLPL